MRVAVVEHDRRGAVLPCPATFVETASAASAAGAPWSARPASCPGSRPRRHGRPACEPRRSSARRSHPARPCPRRACAGRGGSAPRARRHRSRAPRPDSRACSPTRSACRPSAWCPSERDLREVVVLVEDRLTSVDVPSPPVGAGSSTTIASAAICSIVYRGPPSSSSSTGTAARPSVQRPDRAEHAGEIEHAVELRHPARPASRLSRSSSRGSALSARAVPVVAQQPRLSEPEVAVGAVAAGDHERRLQHAVVQLDRGLGSAPRPLRRRRCRRVSRSRRFEPDAVSAAVSASLAAPSGRWLVLDQPDAVEHIHVAEHVVDRVGGLGSVRRPPPPWFADEDLARRLAPYSSSKNRARPLGAHAALLRAATSAPIRGAGQPRSRARCSALVSEETCSFDEPCSVTNCSPSTG